MVKVKIIGAGGYGGSGLLELLARHPQAKVTGVIDLADVGKPISFVLPHIKEYYDLIISSPENPENFKDVDVVFFATPDGVGMEQAKPYIEKGIKVIDFSGDFRFNNSNDYSLYAKTIGRDPVHKSPELLAQSMYGMAELHRAELKKVNIVGNAGCFATSCILGLAPAVKFDLVTEDAFICDCKTGVSGAGKKPSAGFHYPSRYDNMNAYKLAGHQHVFEIKRELGLVGKRDISLLFTPQVVPLCRGILSTLYAKIRHGVSKTSIYDYYMDFYKTEPFVRVFSPDETVSTAWVRGSNFCYLTVKVDEATSTLLVISHIDNLVKGQAGSAVQCMNILFGLDEKLGLNFPPMYP